MLLLKKQQEYYEALLNRDKHYDGLFYVGVKSTGIFCLASCPARKPKFEQCEFYPTAQQALLASYRPCLRCKPLLPPHQTSDTMQTLIDAVEANPQKRWMERDFKALSLNKDASTIRRQFKQRFGMTFVAYARARRLGLAMQSIRKGEKMLNTQLDINYESSSGFRDAFSKIMGAPPKRAHKTLTLLKSAWLDTALGPMLVIADETQLYLLEFVERRGLEKEIERLRDRLPAAIVPGKTQPIESIEKELKAYFEGKLKKFKTPFILIGSDFQKSVWQALCDIPYGKTKSYAEQAKTINKPTAYRAVANANGMNQLAIIVPCHRVIRSQGELGGYGGGIARKQWFLEHERKYAE